VSKVKRSILKGIYIHIPFCKKRCHYCGFYSNTDTSLIVDYINALAKEFEIKKGLYPHFFNSKKTTLYIGGGNPGLIELKDLEKILKNFQYTNFSFEESTIEANPDSITEEKIKGYKELGINRISIGIQSFDDKTLNFLGRNHNVKTAIKCIEKVKKYFNNFSIDIIGGIGGSFNGGKIKRSLEKEIRIIEELDPPHLSFYLLSVEEGLPFFERFKFDEGIYVDDYVMFCSFAKDNGYIHYEISNFAKKGYECLHNKIYWDRNEYLGFGPSAVSFIKKCKNSGKWGLRIKNIADINRYIKNVQDIESEYLDDMSALYESIFLSLRTAKGLNLSKLKKSFPDKAEKILGQLLNLQESGFVKLEKGKWIIPEKHFIISNEIITKILEGADL